MPGAIRGRVLLPSTTPGCGGPPAGAGGRKVAVLDVDFHHGNGTQEIFYERDDVLFVSIHADPDRQYPYFSGGADERGAGRGRGFNINYPLEKGVSDAQYLAALDGACADVTRFAPDFLVVSLGVDTFGGDPLGDFACTSPARRLGQLAGASPSSTCPPRL